MADNTPVKNASGVTVSAATDELSDSSQSPKVTHLDGTGSPTPIDPRTGNVAHDAADAGNPNKVGGRARSSEMAAVANNDRADFITDLVGKLITLPYSN